MQALLGVDVNYENGCITLCGTSAGLDGSTWSTPYTFGAWRRLLPYRAKSIHHIVENKGEELKGVKSIIFRFFPGTQSITAYASLSSKATRGRETRKINELQNLQSADAS